jgi:cytochrome d ubiquinol oxidase subunit II
VIVGLLGALAAGLFPTLLHSTLDPARSLTLYVAASGDYARHVALYWWPLAFALAVTYVVLAFRAHRSPLP